MSTVQFLTVHVMVCVFQAVRAWKALKNAEPNDASLHLHQPLPRHEISIEKLQKYFIE